MDYSYKEYWRNLHGRGNLSAVGQSGLPEGLNYWIYKSIRRNLRRFARRHGLVATGSGRMLEVGVGTGYWIDFWQRLGWQVDGCDLVPEAVSRLQSLHPESRLWVADVSAHEGIAAQSDSPAAAQGYDLVTATSVLLHVTGDAEFARALVNVSTMVAPGGHLLLMEPALTIKTTQADFDPAKHSRARLLRSYVEPLRALGLEPVAVEATTVLAANPLEASSETALKRYHRWWKKVSRSKSDPSIVRWLGPLMYVADAVLMRTGQAPTSKLLLFRKAG